MSQMSIKVYLVLRKLTGALEGRRNVKVIAVRLNRRAANEVAASHEGSWVELHFATK